MAISVPKTPTPPSSESSTRADAARSAWAAHRPPGTIPAEAGKPKGSSKPAHLRGGVVLSDIVLGDRL